MSGGKFDYNQNRIEYIIEGIQKLIDNNGKNRGDIRYPDEYYPQYSEEIINHFKDGIKALRKAYIYTQRIDWLVSGDDSEESFIERLNKELEELKE